ncbi:MAG: glycosyltransferase, exosortase A system-associated [Gammaproteobacteria bacterium]|nr:glycosyltransferase, exosortase A system-associated [Gammaproteobacteria bacterium]
MRILHVFDHSVPIQDGYAYRSLNILLEQRRQGFDTVHLTSAKQGSTKQDRETEHGLEFHRTQPPTGAWTRLPLLDQWSFVVSTAARLEKLVRETKPDLVHAHSPSLNGLAALRVASRHRLPVVYEVRAFWEDAAVDNGSCREGDLRYRVTRALESHVLERADAVTCICAGLHDDMVARGIPREKITVIPNAVDPAQFAEDRHYDSGLAASLGLEAGRTLGFVGSFYAYEGLMLLLEAMPRIVERVPGAKCLLVGGGMQDEALRRRTRELGLEHCVHFTGRVPHAEVGRYYDLVDVLVYPRLSMRITELVTPLKPLEAMAQGRLVVASDVGGHRELITDGRTGRLFRADDAQALAAAVGEMFADQARWPEYREAGLAYVREDRNWKNSVSRYHGVYARAAGRTGADAESVYRGSR